MANEIKAKYKKASHIGVDGKFRMANVNIKPSENKKNTNAPSPEREKNDLILSAHKEEIALKR